jgi:hypothetical protein
MIAMLFLLFAICAALALYGKARSAFWGACLSLLLSVAWFLHHASDELEILL